MKTIAVIYHSADFDGIASGEVCRHFLSKEGHKVHLYGWDYGQPLTPLGIKATSTEDGKSECTSVTRTWTDYDQIYIVDLAVDDLMSRPELRDKIVWIDHHKTSIEKWDRKSEVSPGPGLFSGIRIDGVAACRLCWQWFAQYAQGGPLLPMQELSELRKAAFINRSVSEPLLLTLLGEYDVWDRRDDDADLLQYGIRTLSSKDLAILFESQFAGSANDYAGYGTTPLIAALAAGDAARTYARTVDAKNAQAAYQATLFTLPMICLNGRGNSKNFDSVLHKFPEAKALCLWYYDANLPLGQRFKISLYHHPDYTDIDLSVFAKMVGGGGHPGACGFQANHMPYPA